MAPLLLFLALQEAPVPVTTISQSRDYPIEIRTQVAAYSGCIRRNSNMAGMVFEPAAVHRAYAHGRAECAGLRATLAAEADRALQGRGWSRTRRLAAVEDAFVDIERVEDALAATAARQQAAPARQPITTFTVEVPLGRTDMMDAIAPAILPYLRCRLASGGVPVFDGRTNARIAAPQGVGGGSDCSAVRATAAREADRMLRTQGTKDAAARRALIEKTLADIDRAAASAPATQGEYAPH